LEFDIFELPYAQFSQPPYLVAGLGLGIGRWN